MPAWTATLETGIPDIDRYHQHLFAVFEELRLAAQGGSQRAMTSHLIERLLEGTLAHFAQEEAEMAASGYPDLPYHQAAHEAFSDEVVRVLQSAVNGELVAMPVILVLARRLVDHVLSHDQRLAEYLRATNVAVV